MDVISSHQAGVKQAVATSGTAMTEQHLKILSRLTSDVRLAYDGDDAGIAATERAINLAGNLGINLSVISDYQGAKDPDELIQKGKDLWQKAVDNPKPAFDWLLDKYEEKLNLTTAQGKKEYSDIAIRLISYLSDPIVVKHYEQLVAKRLDVSVEDLKNKKLPTGPTHRLKPIKGGPGKPDHLKVLEDSLISIMLFGGDAGAKINLEIPEDETKLDELSLIFDTKFSTMSQKDLKSAVAEMQGRYQQEINNLKISELSAKLSTVEDNEEEYNQILREIKKLQKG